MSWALLAGVATAGGVGALARAVLQAAVARRIGGGHGPVWGTAAVNVLGSFAAGLVAGLAVRARLPGDVHLVAATGFLGAFTTYSTWMVQTTALLEERRVGAALWSIGSLVVGAAAALGGLLLTR